MYRHWNYCAAEYCQRHVLHPQLFCEVHITMARKPSVQKTPAQIEAQKKDRAAKKIADFKRLAGMRVGSALDVHSRIKVLSNRNAYTYDEVQVTKILNALKQSVNEIEAAFKSPVAAAKTTFEL